MRWSARQSRPLALLLVACSLLTSLPIASIAASPAPPSPSTGPASALQQALQRAPGLGAQGKGALAGAMDATGQPKGMLMDAGAAASASPHVPVTLDHPLSISRIQSAYRAADAISGTLVVTFTVTNNLSPAITPTVPASTTGATTTTVPTSGTTATNDPLGLAHDPHTIHNILLRDSLPQPDAYVDALPAPDRSGGDVVWNLGDVEPLQSVTATLTLHVPPAATDFSTLDNGAGVWGTLQGRAVNAQARPAGLAPDTVADGPIRDSLCPTGDWLCSTVDANATDQYMLDQAGILTQDPLREFAYVQGLGYESYKGSLRGTRGTLWSEAGNSLDKSSLLIAMLRASGIPARYRHGTLSTLLAQQLILSMFPTPTQLVGHIPNGTKLADPANDPKLLAETRDHWWVEAYLPGKGWQDLDPSFAAAPVGQRYVDDSAVATDGTDRIAEVPDTLRHKVTLTVKLETYAPATFTESNFSYAYPLKQTFNSVELVGEPVTLQHLVHKEIVTGLVVPVDLHEYTYTPYLVVGGKVTQGDPFDGLVSFFPFATHIPTAEWLEFDVRDADGNVQHYERVIKDTAGYAARHSGGTVTATNNGDTPFITELDTLTTLFAPGHMSKKVLNQQELSLIQSQQTLARATVDYNNAAPNTAEQDVALRNSTNATHETMRATQYAQITQFYDTYDLAAGVAGTGLLTHIYPDSLRVVTVSDDVSGTSTLSPTANISMDLIRNTMRTVISPNQAATVSVLATMLDGFEAGAVEDAVMSSGNADHPSISVINVFKTAQATGIPITSISKTGEKGLLALKLSSEAKARIVEAVQQGLIVVTPEKMVTIGDATTVGWYEIDPKTGATIDVMEDGRHGLSDYVFLLKSIVGLFIVGFSVGLFFDVIRIAAAFLDTKGAKGAKDRTTKVSNDVAAVLTLIRNIPVISTLLSSFATGLSNERALSTFISQLLRFDPPLLSFLTDSASIQALRTQSRQIAIATRDLAIGGSKHQGSSNATLTTDFVSIARQTMLNWNAPGQHAMLFQSFNSPDASVYDAHGTLLGTGASAMSNSSSTARVDGLIDANTSDIGSQSYYPAALRGIAAGTMWDKYSANITAAVPFSIGLRGVPVTSTNGVYTGSLTLAVPDYANFSGSGPTLAPTFADTTVITGDHAGIMFGPSTVTGGNLPSDPSNGFALVDYSGPLTVTHATANTDRVELGGNADYFAVHTSPANSTTETTTPVTFRATIDSSADDTYTTTVEAPDGWNVALDNMGLVTATLPLGAEPGDYTILVTVQSGSHPDLFASATHTVTVTPHQGLLMGVTPDSLTTVPFGPADPNSAPGDTNNGQLQLTDAAYTVDITNTSTTSHTFNLSESGLPNGWAILSGAGDGATSTSVALPPGGFGQVGLYISPTLEMLPPAGTHYPFTVHVTSPDAPSLDGSAAGTFTVPALSFGHLTADQTTIYSSPGLTATVALAMRNVGNVAGTFPLSVTEPVSTWTAAINSPLTLDPGHAVTQTVTISTPDGALDQDYPVQIASPSGGYTQTVTINVHLVSPAALKIDQAAQTAARVFPGNRALGAALQQLGQSIETLEAKCAGATVLAPAGRADCATDLRDNVVSSAGQVAMAATAASPLITAGAVIQQDAQALSGDTIIGQSQSAPSAKARAALTEQAASAGASTGTVLGDIAVLQGDIAALQGQLQEIGAHGVYVASSPGRRVVLRDKPALFDLRLTNQGSVTSTYALTLTSSSSTLAISPTVADETVAPGATITVPVTATTSTLGSSSITATIAVADAPDLAPLHDVLGVTAVDALLRVTGVTASPPFVEYGSGGAPAVTARIANVANEPIDGTARVRLLDNSGTEVYSATQPLTISSAIRPIDYTLGTITTTNLITGAYTLAVDVLDAQGQIIPRASSTSLLGIGQAVQATSAVSPTIVAPGNVTVTTCISTGLSVSVLDGGAQTPPGGIFLTGHDPDDHAQGGNAAGAQHIIQRAIAYVTNNRTNPHILLVTDLRNPGGDEADSRVGLQDAGFSSFDVADYGSGTAGVLDLHTVNFKNYDVVVVASDYGGWLRQDELDILNARSGDLINYVNGGGSIVAFAESGTRGGASYPGTSHDRFGFLPFVVSSMAHGQIETGFKVTSAGAALGLTDSDVNGNASHNVFTASGGLDVIDTDASGEILSLATRRSYITAGGVANSVCTATNTNSTLADRVRVSRANVAQTLMHTSILMTASSKKGGQLHRRILTIRQPSGQRSIYQAATLGLTSIHHRIAADMASEPKLESNSPKADVYMQVKHVTNLSRIHPSNVTSNGYMESDFATGFGFGVGTAFDPSGFMFVTDYQTGYLYKFAPAGGVVSSATQVNSSPINGSPAGLVFTTDDHLYAALQGPGEIVELNPQDGTIIRTVATGICRATALVQDPLSGDLFVSEHGCGPLMRVSNYKNGPGTVSAYNTTLGNTDGLTFGPDGTLYAAVDGGVAAVSGTNTTTPGTATTIAGNIASDGISVGASSDPSKPPFLLVNSTDGTIRKIDLGTNPPTVIGILSDGRGGDLSTVGPDGCLYASKVGTIVKVTNADGTCSLVPINHLGYIATIDHSVPLTGVNVLTDTLAPTPLTTTVDAADNHLLWQQTLNRSTPITTETFDALLPNMQPGEAREVASGTVITYTGGNAPGALHLGPLFVTAAHLVALSPPTGTVGLGGQAVYTATLANPTGASLALTPTVAGLPNGWAAPLAPVTLTAGGQVDVPLTITAPTSAESGGAPNLLGDHPFAVVVDDSAGGQDQAGATLTVGDSLGLTVTPGVAAGSDGDVVTYTATITNAGAITQSYALSVSGLAPSAVTLPASVTIPAGGAVDVPFTVTVGGPLGPRPFYVTTTSATAGSRADAVLDVLGDRRVAATLSPARAVGGPTVPVLYRLDITNTATLSDTYGFSVSVPAGWSYQLEANGRPVDRLSLLPYVLNAANLSLVVTPSIDATPGDAPISVTVQSRNDPAVHAVPAAALTVTDRGVQVALQPKHTTLAPTDSGTWTVAVTNTGSVADTYVLSPTGVIADAARVTPSTLSLAPGQSGTAEIATGPITYGLAQTYGLGVLATSQSDPAIHNADTGDVTFTGNHGVRVALQPGDQTITGTMQTSYLMVISNTGNLDSYYTFTPHSAPGDLDLTPELGRLEVPAHMTSAILLRVRAHRAGTYTLDVRADSTEGGASATGSATLTIDGSANPSPTAAPTGTAPPTSTPTATPSDTATATATGVPTASPTAMRTGTPPTPAPTATPAAMLIPSPAALSTVTATPPVIPIAAGATPATATPSPIPAGLTSPRSPLPSTGSPTLRLDRQTVAVGDKLCATGAGFLPGEPIALAVDGYAVAQSVASRDGGFTSCFTMPGVIVEGTNSVSAFGARSLTPAVTLVTGVRGTGSTAYLAGASTARGEDTELDIANPGRVAAFVTFRFYRPTGPAFVRSTTVPSRTRATFMLSRYLPGVRGFGLLVRSEQVVAAQMIVRRPRANPYTSLGSGLLSTRWYLAEGYTGLTFHETLYLLNPNDHAAQVRVLLLPTNGGRARTAPVTVPAGRSAALDVNRAYPHAALAAVATSDRPVYVERVLTFGSGGYGATGNAGAALATTTWLFAEGSTAHRDQTFLTVLNPGQRPAKVNALFVDARGRVVGGRTIMVNGLHRGTMRLNDTTHAAALASLVTSDVPVVVERPFYLGNPNVDRAGASLVYGRNGAGSSWTFPAGDTTHGAKEDLLVLNPNPRTLALRATFYLNNRVVVRGYLVPPHARYTLRVNTAARELTNSVHATQLTAIDGRGFVAEQSIYNGDATTIYGTVGMAR
jgi:uncharacterized membrane protein